MFYFSLSQGVACLAADRPVGYSIMPRWGKIRFIEHFIFPRALPWAFVSRPVGANCLLVSFG
ncbi:MAG: hypothetical protein SCK70_13630 [bacterium]|nr:hypothetical protein [bacterium]